MVDPSALGGVAHLGAVLAERHGPTERDSGSIKVDVGPAECDQLATARPGGGCEADEGGERDVVVDELSDLTDLVAGGGAVGDLIGSGWGGSGGRVGGDEVPADRLVERGTDQGVGVVDGSGRLTLLEQLGI